MNGIRYQKKLIQPSMCLDEMFNQEWLKQNEKAFLKKVNGFEDFDFSNDKFLGTNVLEVYYPHHNKDRIVDFNSMGAIPFFNSVKNRNGFEFVKYFFEFFTQLENLQNGGTSFADRNLSIMNDKQHYESDWPVSFGMFNYKIDRQKLLEFESIICYLLKEELQDEVLNLPGSGKSPSSIEPNFIIINFSKNTKFSVWDFDNNRYDVDGVVNLFHGSDHITATHKKSSEIELVFYCWLNVCENHYTKFILDMLLFSYSIWRNK
jgi:hypothetical protein